MVKHKDIYSDNYVTAHTMISELIWQLGRTWNLDCDYGVDATSAEMFHVPFTFEHFGYSSGHFYSYNDIRIYNSLNINRPVIISGNSSETRVLGVLVKSKGHAWIIDNILKRERKVTKYIDGDWDSIYYQDQYLVHCNWGWDGGSNGYFSGTFFDAINGRISPETRSDSPNYYQYSIKILTDVYPIGQ